MTTTGPAPEQPDGATWPALLDELEDDVLAVEALLARDRADEIAAWEPHTAAWTPPTGLGPLPEELRDRAARLLQYQLAVAERLIERIVQSQRQRDLAARMSYADSRPVAAYVDRSL